MKALNRIRKTIQILDSPDYAHYSSGRAHTYVEYFKDAWTDEDRLIVPVLLPKFLEEVLGFKLGQTISAKEPTQMGKPDFVPVDLRTHPFVFEAKGSDSLDLSQHFGEKRKYLEAHRVQYLVITNMRDLEVYTLAAPRKLEEYSFSFLQLYQDFKTDQKRVSGKENTQRFLRFLQHFSFKELTLEEKLQRVIQAKPWSGDEELDVELLTNKLRIIVESLHQDVKSRQDELLGLAESDPERAEAIVKEIEWIASELSSSHKPKEPTAAALREILQAGPKELYGRAFDAFCRRVAYFTMTRILLARAWEDIGFIDQTLYDGGLKKFYENFNREIRRVLRWAFQLAAERYEWLFNVENNYSWYEPSNGVLVEVLYELSNFNLGKLNQDILGTIYEEYIDRIDKKNKGQYYTPREIISFIWDRVGFDHPEAFFDVRRGRREPRPIFDPATGSGGFLVEAARRIREESQLDLNEKRDLLDIRSAIFAGIFGAEIEPFPYYITEVNLLIQLTPVIQRLIQKQPALKREHLPLAVVLVDALSLHNDHKLIKEKADDYEPDPLRSILPLDRRKRVIFNKIKHDLAGKFAYCCANPPYIGEKGHKELFRSTRKRYPYWDNYYQGKMDYLYWFIILGLSKLREGGRLGFITTAYWPTADGAAKLRRYILENAKILEMVFFEDVKIFEYAKGQHNMVFVLERCSDQARRDENRIKIVRVLAKHKEVPGETIREKLRFLTDHIRQHIDEGEYEDRYIRVFWSAVKQGELPKEGSPWHDALVPHDDIQKSRLVTPLSQVLEPYQGIVPNPDRTTAQNIKSLPKDRQVEANEGVFVLTKDEIATLKLSNNEQALIKRSYRNSDICRYYIDIPDEERLFLIYITKREKIESYPTIKDHLLRYREILDKRREVREGKIPWYSLHWPREQRLFEQQKIVCSNWGNDWQPFALQEAGFYERRDITLFIPKPGVKESLFYFLGLLNSSLLINWVREKLKQRGYMRQELQKQIPIRRIDFNNPGDVKHHDAIVEKVKAIREKLAELAKYSKYFDGPRLPRLKFDDPLPPLKVEALLQELPEDKLHSLRTHPDIEIIKPKGFRGDEFRLQRVGKVQRTLEGPQLALKSKDGQVLTLAGPEPLLEVVVESLKMRKGQSWEQIKRKLLLPETADLLHKRRERLIAQVEGLRREILSLQKEINEIVGKLYGLRCKNSAQ